MKILAIFLFMCAILPTIWSADQTWTTLHTVESLPKGRRSGGRHVIVNTCDGGADHCGSTWLPEANLNRALMGIDIAKKEPMPFKPEIDPSVRETIFVAAVRNENLGHMEALDYIHLADQLLCYSQFHTSSWSTMEQYIRGSASSSMSSWSMGYEGPTVSAEIGIPGDLGSIEVAMPPNTANIGSGNSDGMANMEKFFSSEKGSISHSEARCSVYSVEIDINAPSLSLTSSFVTAVKNIDLAKTEDEKKDLMMKFIKQFGSHYARKTIMGIGAIFETRYTGEETANNDKQTLNECTNKAGGFKILGIGSSSSASRCSGSLSDLTDRQDSIVKRFSSTTYGTYLPHNGTLKAWGSLVSQMVMADKLSPVPVQQELALIIDLFATPTIANIVHNDGSKINVGNLLKTAMDGYSRYCSSVANCHIPGCANTVIIKDGSGNGEIFTTQKGTLNGRPVYMNSVDNSLLYFDKGGKNWIKSTEKSTEEMKTSACPQKNFVFRGISYDFFNGPMPGIETWKECSRTCFDRSTCKYWQHNNALKECFLIKDYSRAEATQDDVATGSRDCPGDKSKFAYGLCLENMSARGMWSENGNSFKKGTLVEAYDPTLLILAGGLQYGGGKISNNVNVFFNKQCTIPRLPYTTNKGNLILTAGKGKLLYCGGEERPPGEKNCLTDNGNCVFPFTYNKRGQNTKTYHECTTDSTANHGRYWCATRKYKSWKDVKGVYYGYCPTSCRSPVTLNTQGDKTCVTSKGPCEFPFTYRGKVYNDCTVVDTDVNNRAWCAVNRDDTENYDSTNWWAYCPSTCNPSSRTCWVWEPTKDKWNPFSDLTMPRSASSAVSMPDGVYILGGKDHKIYGNNGMPYARNSDFLPTSSSNWKQGPNLPHDFSDGCAVKISETEFVIIGGLSPTTLTSLRKVTTYNTVTQAWTNRQDLIEGRHQHACAFHPPTKSYPKGYIIVTGGLNAHTTNQGVFGICKFPFTRDGKKYNECTNEYSDYNNRFWCYLTKPDEKTGRNWQYCPLTNFLKTTEIIPVDTWVPKKGGDLKFQRDNHAMTTVGGKYPTVYAMGTGYEPGSSETVEEWDDVGKEWKQAPIKIKGIRNGFSALAVPPNVACK